MEGPSKGGGLAGLTCGQGFQRDCAEIRVRGAQLSRRSPAFVEDQAVDVVGQVGEHDLRFGSGDADGADEKPHLVLLPGEHMLDAGTDRGSGGIGAGGTRGHCLVASCDGCG